ncbi:1,2-phenylacetyl-CoA epoxidase subunit PaaD [Fodinicola acaciae]|uniref:1,2-phenylacetyl-CoA epoxidase subunit PaaD n=1 Tax=Fodinicola acaciae TaxID=2681555 RepID=UPI0013D6D247|nr:1,2-phenylacetyl-CoA epoxidase subunit PaaD [Fodinicola acaciae]
MVTTLADPRDVAETVTDPELPMLTLADLGVLRDVSVDGDVVVVTITPTYSGCPAMDAMRDDLVFALHNAGYADVEVKVALSPAWSSDWISAGGRRKLVDAGIAPPGVSGPRKKGPVPLTLGPTVRAVRCPLCGSADTALISAFGSTSCKSLHRCRSCAEPFEHVKEI